MKARPQAKRALRPREASPRARRTELRQPGARTLHLDPFSGIAGNLFLGALLDAGLSRRALDEDLAGLGVPHRLVVSKVRRGPIAARYVRVVVPGTRAHHGPKSQPGSASGSSSRSSRRSNRPG